MYSSTECLLYYIALHHRSVPTLVTLYVLEVMVNARGGIRAEHLDQVPAPSTGADANQLAASPVGFGTAFAYIVRIEQI